MIKAKATATTTKTKENDTFTFDTPKISLTHVKILAKKKFDPSKKNVTQVT